MSIYDARYRKIEESEKYQKSFFSDSITMSKFEVRRGLSGVWAKIPLILGGFVLFGFLVALSNLLDYSNEEFWKTGRVDPLNPFQFSVRNNTSTLLAPMDGPGGIIIFQIAVVSSGLIAGDLRDRAIDLYFSKVQLREYFISKFTASCILTFIGMPLYALIYFLVAFYKRWPGLNEYTLAGEVLLRVLIFLFIEIMIFSILILFFSAITKNPVNSGIIFLVFILASRVFFQSILYNATNMDIFYTLSPTNSLNILRRKILGPEEIPGFIELTDELVLLSLLSCLLYFILATTAILVILRRETRR